MRWDDRSRTPYPPQCNVDSQIIDLVPRGIGGEVRRIATLTSMVVILGESSASVTVSLSRYTEARYMGVARWHTCKGSGVMHTIRTCLSECWHVPSVSLLVTL